MTSETTTFSFGGYPATVIRPEHPNGKWIWKTEFLHAFEAAEVALCERGYTRVYYGISNMYGSPRAVRLMHAFHKELLRRYPDLDARAHLFGFSRGGLYAFNYALFYPEAVRSIYLDAPVLNLRSWPQPEIPEHAEMLREYNLSEETLPIFRGSPNDNLTEFGALGLPLLLVAGGADTVVPFAENSKVLLDNFASRGLPVEFYFKPECGHHPHSLEDVTPILDFVARNDG